MFTSPFNFKQTPLKRTKKKYLLKKERENRQQKKGTEIVQLWHFGEE